MPLKEPAKTAADGNPSSKFILLGEDDIDDEELLIEVFSKIDNSLQLVFVNNGGNVISRLREMEKENLLTHQ